MAYTDGARVVLASPGLACLHSYLNPLAIASASEREIAGGNLWHRLAALDKGLDGRVAAGCNAGERRRALTS